jgi:hypothetical protein
MVPPCPQRHKSLVFTENPLDFLALIVLNSASLECRQAGESRSSDECRQDNQDTRRKITMMRIAVIVAGVLGMTTLAVHDAAALSAKNRLCVQTARRNSRAVLTEARARATQQQRDAIVACFGPNNNTCASDCTTKQTTCLTDDVTTPRALCETSTNASDGVTSCRESFDAAIIACRNLTTGGNPDFDKQIACQAEARADRFSCSQGCAAQVQPAQDQCGIDFSDCLELCG